MPGMDGNQTLHEIRKEPLTQDIKVVILTSIGRRSELSSLNKLGCSGFLLKPVRQTHLREVLEDALGIRQLIDRPIRQVDRSDHREKTQPHRILVVEDNSLNQKMINILLTRQEHIVELASSGMEAVKAFQSEKFDIIFMDVQMPGMDGLEACLRIREMEGAERHTPIIAMTAYVMQGDVQKCLDAGMDDFIPKPIDPNLVFRMIENWTDQSRHPVQLVKQDHTPASKSQPSLVLDVDQALPRFSGDLEHYSRLLEEFSRELPERMANLRAVLDSADWQWLADQAHNMKGLAANFGAMQLSELAFQLDLQGSQALGNQAHETFEAMDVAAARLGNAIREFIQKKQVPAASYGQAGRQRTRTFEGKE